MAELYSYELERHALCGILQDEKVFIEVESFITDRVFHNQLHGTIFLVAKQCYFKSEVFDKVSIATKIKNLNSFKKIIQNKNNKKLLSRLSNSKKVRTQIVQLKHDVAKPDFGRE